MVPRSVVALIAILLLASSVSDAQTPKRGGVLRIGNLGEPPSLDPHWGTQTITEVLANHVFEGLYALDEGYRPIPMLADGMPTVSKDGLTYGIKLRKGVKFHNGKEVTSDDVVASVLRWGKRSVYGKSQRRSRSEEHTSELQSLRHLVCRLLLEKKKNTLHNRYE